MQKATGFNDPYELAKCFVNTLNLPLDAKIIDFGCGTGLCGDYLHQAGYRNLYGLDGSKEMLEVAKSKNLYTDLKVLLVGIEEIQKETPRDFDLAVASACMIKGHFPNSCFKQMLSCVRIEGYIAFTIRDIYLDSATDNGMNYKSNIESLVNDG